MLDVTGVSVLLKVDDVGEEEVSSTGSDVEIIVDDELEEEPTGQNFVMLMS